MSLFWEVFGTALALSVDAVVVSLCWSTVQKRITTADVLKFAVMFGLFQGLMPAIGWTAGYAVAGWISQWDHWVASALLAFVAYSMIKEGLEDDACDIEAGKAADGISLWTLTTLAVATSLDALAVGFSFAMADYPIVWPALLIAAVCFVLTAGAVRAGKSLSQKTASHTGKLSLLGAAVLIAIGVKILWEHDALNFIGL